MARVLPASAPARGASRTGSSFPRTTRSRPRACPGGALLSQSTPRARGMWEALVTRRFRVQPCARAMRADSTAFSCVFVERSSSAKRDGVDPPRHELPRRDARLGSSVVLACGPGQKPPLRIAFFARFHPEQIECLEHALGGIVEGSHARLGRDGRVDAAAEHDDRVVRHVGLHRRERGLFESPLEVVRHHGHGEQGKQHERPRRQHECRARERASSGHTKGGEREAPRGAGRRECRRPGSTRYRHPTRR